MSVINNNIDINAAEAWQLSTGLNGVRVAVIDDGVEAHDDLNGRVLQGFTPLEPNGFGGLPIRYHRLTF